MKVRVESRGNVRAAGGEDFAVVLGRRGEAVDALLMETGCSPELGARPMERAVEALIAQPLAKAILEEQGGVVIARVSGGKVTFDFA